MTNTFTFSRDGSVFPIGGAIDVLDDTVPHCRVHAAS